MTPTSTYRDPGPGCCATPAAAIVGIGLVFATLAAAGLALASREAEASPPPVPAVQVCYAAAAGPSRCGDLPPASTAGADEAAVRAATARSAGIMIGEMWATTAPADPPP
jgi:hypothetical protein